MNRHHPLPAAGTRRGLLRRRDQKGAALVEFAMVVGLFVMILYGLIYFGMALATKQRVTNAAAEGARAAVGATDTAVQGIAEDRVKSLLGEPNGRYTVVPVAAACDSGNPTGPQCITVTISWDWENHPVVPAAPGLRLAPVDTLGSKATVQYRA
ncbi:MAG: TadE family protein [Acidimicrobiales bacterium]